MSAEKPDRKSLQLRVAELEKKNSELEQHLADQHAQFSLCIQEKQNFYIDIFEKNKAVKLIIDTQSGRILDANIAACDFYGYHHEELITKKLWELNVLGEELTRSKMADCRTSTLAEFHVQHKLASGEVRDVMAFAGPVMMNGRRVLYAIVLDVSESKKTEREANSLAEKYRRMFQFFPDGIFVARESDLRIVDVNDAGLSLLGRSLDEVLGRTVAELDFLEPPGDLAPLLKRFGGKGEATQIRSVLRPPSGEPVPAVLTCVPLELPDGGYLMISVRTTMTDGVSSPS
ncbi:MAG: hypothetical protein CVU65_05355 [Deltaproteobacteria bacterium HGW-Deltaproteobacteria-22]|jgi:PAS domain S-box-containing protein|nr:MAG: hypothetical protein CVU65_05355 [Deltaproteobacteria bacterium HGW-Deltaproteobacteria-22]